MQAGASAGFGGSASRAETYAFEHARMARALEFGHVIAGHDNRGYWHVYYRRYYVGTLTPTEDDRWAANLHDIDLGRFASLQAAQRAVAQEFYGPDAEA
jgi:hypothetical protein